MTVDPDRSRIMAAVKSYDTRPEMEVRRLAHRLGYRFRLHRKDLPGKPDIVFAARRSVIFVHGCYWHGHDCKRGARLPKTNCDYWRKKIDRNRERDVLNMERLMSGGWRVLVIWECQMKDCADLARRLVGFLGNRTAQP